MIISRNLFCQREGLAKLPTSLISTVSDMFPVANSAILSSIIQESCRHWRWEDNRILLINFNIKNNFCLSWYSNRCDFTLMTMSLGVVQMIKGFRLVIEISGFDSQRLLSFLTCLWHAMHPGQFFMECDWKYRKSTACLHIQHAAFRSPCAS